MADNKRLLPYIGIGVLVLIVIVAVVVLGGGAGGFLSGAAGPQEDCYWDPYLEEYVCEVIEEGCFDPPTESYVPCEEETAQPGAAEEEEVACGLFSPDVGDAVENGLISTDAEPTVFILIATDQQGNNVVANISDYHLGTDTFQVPEQYRSTDYWFKVSSCGRWHNGAEFGFGE